MNLIQELLVLTEEKPARRVPAGTFTPKKAAPIQRDPNSEGYDWRNPDHNPKGEKPAAASPHKYTGKYNPDNYPVLDEEFDSHFFNPEIVAVMKDEYKGEWNKMSELDQIKCQLDWIAPPPRRGDKIEDYYKALDKRAEKIQKEIKRG